MTPKEFIKQRGALLKSKKAYQKTIDLKYTALEKAFIKVNSPIKTFKVYEVVSGIRRRGFTRFVVYVQNVQWFSNHPLILVGGWWLDKNNTPSKWDTMTIYGVGNPAKFTLSENQKNEKHPDTAKK